MQSKQLIAVLQAVLVTTIWASSFIFLKIALDDLDPLTIGGFRYFLGAIVLLPFTLRNGTTQAIQGWSRKVWLIMLALGISCYTLGNGLGNWGLTYISATTGSFIISLTPLIGLLPGIFWLKEIPSRWQWVGVVVSVLGSLVFFSPGLGASEVKGVVIMLLGVVSFVVFSLLGRAVVVQLKHIDALTRTTIPLLLGGGLLLIIALLIEGKPNAPLRVWAIILWLTIVNTAFAYWLYNVALNTLTALEMNMVLNLSPLETAFLAWIFLDDALVAVQLLGMVVMIVGIALVQFGKPEIWQNLRYPRGATRF